MRTRDLEQARTRSIAAGDSEGKDVIARQFDAASESSGSELGRKLSASKAYGGNRVAVVHGLNRPLFHTDLTSALQSAIANVDIRGEGGLAKGVGTEGN